MTLVVPYMAPFLGEELGPETMQGVYGGSGFWWTLQDKYPIAKDFVEAFEKKFNKKPHDSESTAYMVTLMWADGIARAGTFYHPDVYNAMEIGVKIGRAQCRERVCK